METKIEDFNWNLRLFLDVINSYQTSVNKANASTLILLEKTLDKIGDLIESVDEVESSQNDVIQCTFDENIFEVKRTMFCHICKVDFVASRLNHLLHLADPKHNGKLINNKQGDDDASMTNNTFYDSNNNTGKTESLPLKNGVQTATQQYSLQSMLENHRLERAKVVATSNNVAAAPAIIRNDALNVNNNAAKNETTTTQKVTAPKVIPNVFDDGIYDFIESSIAKSDVGLPKRSLNENEADSVVDMKYGFHKESSTDSAENVPLTWRQRANEPRMANTVQKYEIRRLDKSNEPIVRKETFAGPPIFYQNPNMYATPMMMAQPKVERQPMMVPPPFGVGQQQPAVPITQSIIQNGAVLTGFGVKPCPTYELNNLYLKFPHLNSNKVTNPLKPVPLDKRSVGATKRGDNAAKPAGGLQDLFNKINKENQLKKSESTDSLYSLPSFGNKNAPANHAKYRLPERSASSLNLTGITRIDGANPQKGNRRTQSSVGQNGHNKQQSNGQNRNGSAKGPSAPLNDTKSKGAIPKHSTQTASSNGKKIVSNDAPKTSTVQNAQQKDVKNAEQPKLTTTAESKSSDSLADLINDGKLKRFFSSDLSALISLMVEQNVRVSKSSLREKLIETVEKTLKEKFKTLKCHVIGSHNYNVAKGGRAPLDIYLDLHDSFHADKSAPIIVNGMNEALKLFEKSGDWSDAKCNEQTRYGILSATYKPTEWKCNFTFGTGVAVRNSDIIGSLFDAQPVARQLVISVRLALQEGAIGDWAKHFTGYVVTLLVIFYLQTANKLPKIVDLQSTSTKPVKCGENLVHFDKPTNVAICKDRIRDLLIGFFEFYGKFDFFHNIISPYEGREINQMFRNHAVDSLSRSMRRFKSLIDSEPKRWTNNRMCIQDIFEHKRNVGAAIDAKETKAFKALCGNALKAIHDAGSGVKY